MDSGPSATRASSSPSQPLDVGGFAPGRILADISAGRQHVTNQHELHGREWGASQAAVVISDLDGGVHAMVGGRVTDPSGLAALGFRFLDSAGRAIMRPAPATWENIQRIDGTGARPLPPLHLACDVTNPLLGPRGAAAAVPGGRLPAAAARRRRRRRTRR